jgi:citronellol/citronellal dehydrogenase
VAPGVIATSGMNVYPPDALREMPKSNPMKRFGQAEDIANAVCYIAGPAGAFITGEVLTVDGGNQAFGVMWAIPRPDYFGPDATG